MDDRKCFAEASEAQTDTEDAYGGSEIGVTCVTDDQKGSPPGIALLRVLFYRLSDVGKSRQHVETSLHL